MGEEGGGRREGGGGGRHPFAQELPWISVFLRGMDGVKTGVSFTERERERERESEREERGERVVQGHQDMSKLS